MYQGGSGKAYKNGDSVGEDSVAYHAFSAIKLLGMYLCLCYALLIKRKFGQGIEPGPAA